MDWIQNLGLALSAACICYLAVLQWNGPLVPWRRARKVTRDARKANRREARDRKDGWS